MTLIYDEKYKAPYELSRIAIIQSLIPPGRGRLALDLGCGSGLISKILVERGWEVTAVDNEPRNIDLALRVAQHGIVGDVLSVLEALPKKSFDLVLALELIEHLTTGKLLLQRIYEVTKNDGFLVTSTPNRISPEGLSGYYWGEKVANWGKWMAWDESHVKIYSSFEFIGLLREVGWQMRKVYGFWYRGQLPFGIKWALPFTSSKIFPFNRLGFNTISVCERVG
jgi:2-polyprenyl-6-hydroxyphenyl methylase / 3-demethylubiquinone-9 3-methyltransferase